MERLRTKDIAIDNHSDVFAYFGSRRASKPVVRGTNFATRLLFHPSSSFSDDAEDQIGALISNRNPIIFGSNHLNMFDQQHILAVMQKSALSPITEDLFAIAKIGYFQSLLTRILVEKNGGIPGIRPKDIAKGDYTETEARQLTVDTSKELGDTAVSLLGQGMHLGVFPGGERKRENKAVVGAIGVLTARIAFEANASFVPVGIAHSKHNLKTHVRIGNPLDPPYESPLMLKRNMQKAMQFCVTKAFEHLED